MNLAEKVKQRRLELGWSQDELSTRMGYKSRTSVNKIEKGRPVTQKIIYRLASVLDVPVSWLMGWDEEEEENAVNHQQTDFAANVLVKLGESEDFATAVKLLYNLDAKQLAGVVGMLRSFSE